MEDQEFRVLASYCDSYAQSLDTPGAAPMETPLAYLLHRAASRSPAGKEAADPATPVLRGGATAVQSSAQSFSPVVFKVFAQVYDRKVWKRRLLLLTERMLLVVKRPDDHYLKNALALADTAPVCATVSDGKVGVRGGREA